MPTRVHATVVLRFAIIAERGFPIVSIGACNWSVKIAESVSNSGIAEKDTKF